MKKRRLAFGALTFAACTPITPVDAGTTDSGMDAGRQDAGHDAGPADAGADPGKDAGYDAGVSDGGCPCPRGDGSCPIPPDFPEDAGWGQEEQCLCVPNPVVFCLDETSERCASWQCNPIKEPDGGVRYTEDGGVRCLC